MTEPYHIANRWLPSGSVLALAVVHLGLALRSFSWSIFGFSGFQV
jgi:hypothetical protein